MNLIRPHSLLKLEILVAMAFQNIVLGHSNDGSRIIDDIFYPELSPVLDQRYT